MPSCPISPAVGNGSCGHPICFMTHRMQPLIVIPQRSAEARYGVHSSGEYNGYVMGLPAFLARGKFPDKNLMVLHRWNTSTRMGMVMHGIAVKD